MDLITDRIGKRYLLLFVLPAIGLILSLVGIALWRGEQEVEAGEFQLVFSLSILGTVIFTVLLIVAALYLRKLMKQ